MAPALFISALIGIFALIIFLAWRYEKKRTEGLQAFAEGMGFSFKAKTDKSLLDSLGPFCLFSRGHSHKVKNLISSSTGDLEVMIFDYAYTVGGGKNSHTYNQSVAMLTSPQLDIPKFELKPQHFFHKIGKTFGMQDIDFRDFPVFSEKYLFQAKDAEKEARAVFTNEILSYFDKNHGLCLEGDQGRLVFYKSGKREKPEEMRAFLEKSLKIYSLFVPVA